MLTFNILQASQLKQLKCGS